MEYTKDNIAGLRFIVTEKGVTEFTITDLGRNGSPVITWMEGKTQRETTKYTSKQICHYLNTGMWVVKQ